MWTSEPDFLAATSASETCDDVSWPRHSRVGGSVRLFNARTRRRLVRSLRRLASRRSPRDAARRFEVLLHERVDLVRDDLLEIAALLERELDPDPGCIVALHRLLTDGCASPLYNRDVHPSELRTTLYYVRSRLGAGRGERVRSLASDSRAARY